MTYGDDDPYDEGIGGPSGPPRSRSRAGSSRSSRGRSGRSGSGRPPRSGGGAGRPPGQGPGAAALQKRGVRLAILAGLGLVIILVLITSIRGCQRDRLVSSYKSYMTAANTLSDESRQLGEELQVLLENKSFKAPTQVGESIAELATRAKDLTERATRLEPPDRLKASNRTLVTVLEYRRDGLTELATAVKGASAGADQENVRATLLEPLKALGASDVIFKRSFLGPTTAAFQADDIKDVNVQPSYMFPDGAFDAASEAGVAEILNNLKQVRPSTGTTTGDKHGLDIASVFAIANGQRIQLSTASLVEVPASPDLAFEVTVEDGGDFLESNVPVTFTYSTPSDPTGQEQKETIASIEPGADNAQKVTFRIATPYTREPSTIKVTAGPVPLETKIDNNTATYNVQFLVSG